MCLLLMSFVTISVQGDSEVLDMTAGDDFLCLCDQKFLSTWRPSLSGFGVTSVDFSRAQWLY
jgi:hypothetical protein